MKHIHSVYDSDIHFLIDSHTRTLKSEEGLKTSIQQYDHNSERITFELPRLIDGHDMSTCNQVSIHYINIDTKAKVTKEGIYVVDDLQVSPESEEVVIWSWLISRNATQYAGTLNFIVKFRCSADGEVDYEWNTAIYKNISVEDSINNSEAIEEDYADILAQWEKRITTIEEIAETASNTADIALKTVDELKTKLEDAKPKYTKADIDPIFANNSWDLIKWVCQHDDPSKYWKVGDYHYVEGILEISNPKLIMKQNAITSVSIRDIDEVAFSKKISTVSSLTSGTYRIRLYPEEVLDIQLADGKWIVKATPKDFGIDCTVLGANGYYALYEFEVYSFREIPLQIIGFNHDKVTDPYNYGKQRAGMTLQLGACRTTYGDTKPSLFEGTIDGLMADDGVHFKSPNSVLADLTTGATNWANSGFRTAIQTLFDSTDIAPYLVEVKKQTSHHYQDGQRYSALMDTNDKVFLPSEYEYFGEVLYAPAKEGEQYELYREGASKFMWSNELLDGTTDIGRLHFRSGVGSKVNAETDSKYNSGLYLTVKSLSPLSVSYTHSYSAGGAYIAPCFCL